MSLFAALVAAGFLLFVEVFLRATFEALREAFVGRLGAFFMANVAVFPGVADFFSHERGLGFITNVSGYV